MLLPSEDTSHSSLAFLLFLSSSLQDSQLIHGVAFKKTFSYAGFEMQPKTYDSPKVSGGDGVVVVADVVVDDDDVVVADDVVLIVLLALHLLDCSAEY
jgi:hypothetical protein